MHTSLNSTRSALQKSSWQRLSLTWVSWRGWRRPAGLPVIYNVPSSLWWLQCGNAACSFSERSQTDTQRNTLEKWQTSCRYVASKSQHGMLKAFWGIKGTDYNFYKDYKVHFFCFFALHFLTFSILCSHPHNVPYLYTVITVIRVIFTKPFSIEW